MSEYKIDWRYINDPDAPDIDLSIDNLTSSLAENVQQQYNFTKQVTAPYNYSGAVVSIVDDDGTTGFLTNMQPILDQKGVKVSLGIITSHPANGDSSYMTTQQLKDLQSQGHEILCHSLTHSASIFQTNLSSVPSSSFDTEFSQSQQWLMNNGFDGYDTIVYPYGNFTTEAVRIKGVARKYFKYGMNAQASYNTVYNTSPNDNLYLSRYGLNKNSDFTTVVKPMLDSLISAGAWLIIMTHSYDTTIFDGTYLGTIIDYLQSNNVPILPFRQAAKYKGNAISIGEYSTTGGRYFIGNDGKQLIDNPTNVYYTSATGATTYTQIGIKATAGARVDIIKDCDNPEYDIYPFSGQTIEGVSKLHLGGSTTTGNTTITLICKTDGDWKIHHAKGKWCLDNGSRIGWKYNEPNVVAKPTTGGTTHQENVGNTITNTGATGSVAVTLAAYTSLPGAMFRFVKTVNQPFTIAPNVADTIRGASAAGKYISLTNVGDSVTLLNVSPNYWEVIQANGSYTFQP